jgi:hypothetical protein
MLMFGQTLQSAGLMVGGVLAKRAHQQHAEAKDGKLKGLIDETPPSADPTKPPPATRLPSRHPPRRMPCSRRHGSTAR